MADIISNSNGPDYGAGLTALMKAGGAAPASPQGNIRNLVDPRKVYLARQAGTADGLNDIEKDFAFGDFQNNVSKYGSQAYAVDADIASMSGNDFVKSQVTRTPGETAVDVATGLGLGTADFMLQAGQFLNNISPLGWADRAFGTQLAKPLNDAFSAARHANTNLMNSLYSDVKRHGEEIKEYKNQLDEARHLREQEEAIANGESAFGATMARFAKDAGSAIGNALSTPTALVDMPVDLLASILSMKGLGKLGLGVAKGAGALTDALAGRTATRAGIAGAERAGVAGAGTAEVAGATAGTAERAGAGITGTTEATAGAGTEAATGASTVAGTAGNTATRAATTAAEATAGEAIANQGEGWLAKIGKGFWDKRREIAHVAIQEGGAGTSMAYDTVNRMSYDELEKSSEMFREKKKKYLEQGMSEEQASARAKDEVAQAAAFDAGALQGIIAGPMGRFMPDGLIKSPLKTFFNGKYANNIIRETGEEALEGLGQFGYNVGAKNTYNNDQDLMKDMGRSIGEGAISALVGTAEMGAPRAALRGLGIGTGAVLGKTAKAIDNHQTKNNINTVRNASETLAQSAEALNTAEAAQANASSSNVYSNEDARDSLNKINGINTGFTAEEASEINSAMGMQDTDQGAAKEGENKFEALVGMAQFLAERLKPENLKKDQDSITTLNQVRAFNKIYRSVFEAQPINEILDQIKDEDTKKQVQQAYEAYNKLSQNKAFTGLQKTATAHARQIIAARQDVNAIVNDDKLTDDEKIKRIDETIAAFNLLFDNSLPSDKDLATARNVAEAAQASGLGINQAAVTSFLDEVNTREQQNVALREAVTAEEAMNEKVAQTVGVTTDDIENFRNNKTISDVAYQKLKQYYGSDTNRLSLSDVIQKVQYHYYHNNEAMVTQTITDYFNYIQSQVNKLNAYRESYAQYQQDLADAKAHGKAFSEVRAQPVQYESYNPEGRVRFKDDKTVIYAGDPALGAALVDETEALVGQFGILKKMFFKGKKLSLKGYKPNEGVTNEQIRDTYKTYVSMKQTKTGKQSADEQTLRETRQNNNSENTNTQQQPTENQTQPKESTNPKQDSNDSREAAQQEVPSADDSSLANDDIFDQNNAPADNNTKPVDNTNNKPTENTKPVEQAQDNTQNQKPKNYWDIGNLSLKDYLGNMFHGSDAILQGIADVLSGDTHSDEEIEKAVRTAIFQNSFNTGKDVGSKVESAIIKATKHYFSEKAKQKNTEQAKPKNTNTIQENHTNPSETNNAKPEETPEKRKQRELAEAWEKALNEENNESTSPSVDTNTNTDNNSSSQSEQDSNTQENQNNSAETQNKPNEKSKAPEYLDNTNSTEETATETTSEETSSNTTEQTNESVEDTTVVEDSTDSINEATSTSFLDEVRENVHRVQKRLYKFVNEKFLPYKELIDQLRNAVTDNDFRTQLNKDLTQKDATFLLNALDYSNPHSFINDFTRKLKAQLEPNATINEVAVSFPVAMTSPFYGIHKEKGEVKLSKVTYSEVLSVFRDPAKLAKVSDDELQRIYNLFPSLMLMDINEKGQAILNKDMVANLALNALAVMSDNKNGSGASWDQIATSLGMDLADIKSIRNADGENVGYQFLKTVSEGAIVTPLFDAMSRNIKKSLGLSFNRRYVSLAATQATSDVLANMVLKALTDESNGKNTNYFTLKKFDVGNGIAVISQNTENSRSKKIFTDFENVKGVNELIQNDRVGEIGDIVIDGKESEPAESTQTRYLHTGIELRPKAKAALHNYEKVKYRIDEDMADIYESLVNEEGNGLLSLYGEDVSGEMDADDKLSKDSVNSLITNAWNKFKGYKDEMQAVADENHVPLSSIRKRFKYAFTTVNRIQELESYGPTANKLMREVMLSTWNTMDLTGPNKDTHKEDLARAVVQNFGGKLNANDFETGTLPAFNQIFSEVQNHPEKFTNLMQLATNPSKVTTQTVKDAKAELEAFMKNDKACKAIGLTSVDTNFMGLHAMQTLAKVVKAEQEGKDSVEVSIYCEADGTTNGTINTQFLMTNHLEESKPEKGEQITYDENGHEIVVDGDYHDPAEHTILLQDKGNMRLGDYSGTSAGTAKSQYKDTETKDVYALAGKNAQTAISKHVELFTNYVNFTHEASNKYPKGREVLPDHYYQAVDFLFKFSGLTKNLHTRLEDNITRNFMKSPCTKGMYGAGIKSIINTFLYGDRNVSGIIHELHTARTRAMRAYAKAEAEGQVLNDQTVELLVAKAIFGKKGWSKDTENWTDDDYRTHLRQYCWALNTVTQNSLVQYKDKKDKRWHIFCKPVYIFNSEPNSFNANGYYYHRNFTKDTFLNDKIQANQGCATLNLSNANVENIFNAVQTIYGDTIAQTVTGTIRGNNVRGTQDSLLEFAKQSTLLGNIVALVKIKNNKPNESYGRDDLVDFNDEHSPISNVLAADTAAFPIGYDERHSREELSGGSITNYEQFGRYSKVIRNSLYNFIGTNSGEYKYTYLGNPGVRLLPNMAIAFGDGDMMQTAMNSDTFLDSINYATTLIFDGGNAAVGMMHDYGKAINQIQFETDMRNILDPVLVKTASQLAYVENQLNIENSPLHEACQLMADALSFVQDYQDKLDKNGKPLAKQPTSPVYFDALIENLVSCVGQVLDCGTRRSGIKHFLQSRLGKITPANAKGKYVSPVYSSEDFNYNNFNIKTLRSKIKQQVYREIEASLGQTRMLQLVPQNKANNYEVTQEAFNAYQAQLRKKANASIKIPTSINEMQRRELKDCLNMFFGREEYISNGYRFIPGASVSTYCNSDLVANQIQQNAERILDIIQDTTAKIATIQTAKYCMGGTYDHMASHDAPFIHTPTEEGFGKFLDQMHLKFRDNRTTVHSLWTKVQKLTDCLHGETVCSVKKRAEVLRDLQHLIQEYTVYKNDSIDAESARVIENLNKPKPEDSKNIKTISVKQYLKENKAFHAVSAMLGQLFSAITLKGINKDTQIKYFTSSKRLDSIGSIEDARANAINILKRTYSQDMQNRIDKEKNLEQKAKLELNRTQTLTYITNKVKEDRLSEGEIAPIQFYDANTNTIYIVPTNPSGINSKAESDLYLNERLPHEIMHSIADKFITHYWKDLKYLTDKGSLNALAEKLSSKDNAKSRAFKRKTYALKALWRLNKLREEFDSIDPKLLDSVSSSSTQLKNYLVHMARGDWKDNPDQALKEFIATVGSLSDEQIMQLDKVMNQQAPGSLEYLVNRTKQDHSSKTLSAIFNAVKKAFTEFLAAIFNTSKSDPSLRDVIHSNLTIMSAVNEFNRTNREEETITTQLREQLSEAVAQTSFLDEVDNNSTDTNVSVDATSGSAELNSVPETHESSLDRLSNSLTRAIKERFRTHAKPFERSSKPNTNVLRKENQKENILADAAYITNTTGANLESTINSVVTPLQNLGYEVENPKTFANVVSALSLLQGLKAPILTDVNLAIKKVLDKLTPEALCEDPNNQDELAKAQGLVDFIFNTNKDGLTTEQITPVILALSQTDSAFKRFLSTLPNTKTKHSDEYLALDRFFDNVINKAADQIDKLKHNKSSTMSNKFDQMVKAMSRDERSYNKINFAENALNKVENAISDTIDRLARAALRKMGKDENLSIRGLLVQGENNLNNFKYTPHWVSELIHDALGTHPDSYERYAAFSRVKTAVQQTRENARKKTPLILKRKLKGVTQKQWESFTRTIGNTGLSSLFIKNSTKNLATLLRSQSQIKDSIKQLEDVIKDNYRISKCKQLANYQMTGKAGKMLLVNPIAIAKGLGSSNTNMKPTKTEITACDRLTSLYAVQMLSEKERTELADLLEKNPSGMKHLLTVTKNQYKEGIAKANGVNRGENNWRKGVHASAFNNAAHYKVVPLAEREQMERMGYKFISNYQGSNADTAKLGIFYSKLSSTNILNPGAIQNTTATANGVNLSSGFSLAPNAGRITSQKDIKSVLSKMGQYSSKNDEDLIPIFDNGGNIVGFERTLNPKLLKNNKYVKPETDFAKLLGIQEGRNIEEKMITDFNKEIVNLVHKTWLNEDGKYKEADFVDLFAEQDPVIKNVVQMMPKEVKQQIKDVYGGNHFYVLRSEVNDVIGYHSASITDSWTGESRLPEPVQKAIVSICEGIMGKNAYKYLKTIETAEQNVVKAAKNAIIVRSLVVPTMNLTANVIQLWIEGVPLTTIMTEMPKVTKELQQYTRIQTQLLELNQELAGETNEQAKDRISKKIDFLTKAQNQLSIAYLLNQKEFATIADIGDSGRDFDFANGTIGDQILEHIDNMSDSNIVRSLTHYAMVAPDTSLYKFLEKTNQYGDFLGRAILFKELTQNRGWTNEQAHLKVKDEFVDYSRLPGRGRDFLERSGLLWFYNFKLRMMKVAAANLKEHPLRSLALTYGGLATPMSDSLLGKLPVLGYSIGPGMLMSAFTSNPWVMLLGLLF